MTTQSLVCLSCGTALEPGQAFCPSCGTAVAPQPSAAPVGPDATASTQPTKQSLTDFLVSVGSEKTGIMAAVVVFVVCLALAYATWWPLSQPSKAIRDILPNATCTGKTPGTTSMYICSAKVGALQVVGPVVMMGLVYVFRRQIKAWLNKTLPSMPEEGRFLFAPVIATLAFTLSWAGFHYDTADLNGLLPQRMFPVVIAIFTFGVARWGPALQRSFAGFFAWRDTFPVAARLAVLIGVPILLSYLITNQDRVSDTATKEQEVVIVALALGFLMLAPRQGNVLAGMGQTVAGLKRQP